MIVTANKKLGQHFLRDGRVIERIAAHIAQVSDKSDEILEIGPGTGALTRALLELPNKIILLEKDRRCVEALKALLVEAVQTGPQQPLTGGNLDALRLLSGRTDAPNEAIWTLGRVTLLEADALEADWSALAAGPTVVVGNLPYNVGTEIVADLLHAANQGAPVKAMVFMLQKEVVQRLTAQAGGEHWGRLGVLAHLLADTRRLFDVPPGAFAPPPKVMSSIVELIPLPKPRYEVDLKQLDRLLRAAFGQRRKMLRASLKGLLDEASIKSLGIEPTARPETLTTEQLCRLANAL